MRRARIPAIALWLLPGAIVALVTSRVADWFVMTDELLYERLALEVDRLHSPLPHVHGAAVASVNQLYPLLLALPFAHGSVAHDLRAAHVLNGFVMASAALPAHLLARRAGAAPWLAAVAALLTVALPWIVLSSFLLTEVAAYPAFLWAVVAFHATLARPSARNDVLAALALGVAIGARTQLAVLALVPPVAFVCTRSLRAHRTLAWIYAVGALFAVALLAAGHNPLGTYSSAAGGNLLSPALVPALFSHVASVATGLALLPVVVGGAWLVASARSNELALLLGVTIVLLTLEAASYDVRFGEGIVRDRYVFYVAPLFAVAFAAGLARPARWSLAAPLAVLAIGYAVSPLPAFEKLNADTPVSVLDGYLRAQLGGVWGARAFLVAAVAVAAALVLEGSILLRPARLAAVLGALVLVLVPAETAYAFARLFHVDGTAGRPLTVDPSGELDWIDRAAGSARVTMLPYPVVSGEYYASGAYWWDVEFWNRSVNGSAGIPGEFEWTPSTFPKLALRFDRTGRANVSPRGLVLQAVADARFHLAGSVVTNNRGVFLVQPEEPWRADWLTAGLYDDGWTKPGVTARVRVFAYPGQHGRVTRSLTVSVFAPSGIAARPLALASNLGTWRTSAGENEVSQDATVCVPPHGSADVRLTVDGASAISGDPRTDVAFAQPRRGGVQVSRIYLSGAVAGAC